MQTWTNFEKDLEEFELKTSTANRLDKTDFRDVNGTRFSRVPKKFPVPRKKNSGTGEFRDIAYNPSLQNSVVTVCKSTDAAQWTLPDAGRRHFVHNSSRCLLIDVTSR